MTSQMTNPQSIVSCFFVHIISFSSLNSMEKGS